MLSNILSIELASKGLYLWLALHSSLKGYEETPFSFTLCWSWTQLIKSAE